MVEQEPRRKGIVIKKAIEEKVAAGSKNLYVLVNYTALFSTRKILVEMQKG